jgi:hypothetical protein
LTLDPIISEFVPKNTDRYFAPGRPGYPLSDILREETKRIDISTLDR